MTETDNREQLEWLYALGRFVKWAIGAALVFFFGFLQFKNASFGSWLEYTSPTFFIQVALAIYYLSFFFGPGTDHNLQRKVFRIDPSLGQIAVGFFLWIPLFVAIAWILLWASQQSERYFAIALSVYFVVDVLGWANYVNWARPIMRASQTYYDEHKEYFKSAK